MSPTSEEMPQFSGPFAAEYQEAWRKSETPRSREILADGKVSDQEWAQVLSDLKTCLAESGITLVSYNEDGSYESNVGSATGASANDSMGTCEKKSGEAWIGRLYRDQTSNPTNIPETKLLTECLIRNNAVPKSYTVEQYLVDAPLMSFPYVDHHGEEIFEHCNADMDYVR